MDRPDAVGQCGCHRRLPSSPVGHHAGLEGGGAARPVACRAIARSVRGYCAGYLARGASAATHLGRESAVRAVAVHHCAQQADRRAASPRPPGVRGHRRFHRGASRRGSAGGDEWRGHRGASEDVAATTARCAAVDLGRWLVDHRDGEEIRDEGRCGASGASPWTFDPRGARAERPDMKTDDLIASLVADHPSRMQPVWMWLLAGLFAALPLFSAPFLIAALLMLRKGATSRPMLMGAFAGLMSAGLGATLYAAHCMDDSPLFVATWYTLAAAFVTFAGAMIGRRVLRF